MTLPHPTIVDVDPEDPAQTLDDSGDFHVEPLEVDAEPTAEAADDVDRATAEAEPGDDDVTIEASGDTGELYGVHTLRADDRDLAAGPDSGDYPEAEAGENWLEALEQHSAESGPTVEHEVTIVDDSDPHHGPPPTDFRDRPKADRGSGGPGGL